MRVLQEENLDYLKQQSHMEKKTFDCELKCQNLQDFHKPAKKADLPQEYNVHSSLHVDKNLLNSIHESDLTWALARLDLSEVGSDILNIKPKNQIMPSWSVSNAVLSERNIKQKRVAFLPVLPYPVTV